ncbi:MAG: 50S ribosomal protein L15 [Simkaniaceae bacterium]|nr:50S ribosomal protein L15 [Simkaniaceae bacterium]
MITLHNLSNEGRRTPKRKRVGRGPGSKLGKTAGRGYKGDKSRSGYKSRYGKEGGQLPLFKKLPTRGFSNVQFRIPVFSINLGALEKIFNDGDVVSKETLLLKGYPLRRISKLKILAGGELTKKIKIEAHAYTKSAEEKLKAQSIEFKTI